MTGEDGYYVFASGTYKVGRKGSLQLGPVIDFHLSEICIFQ